MALYPLRGFITPVGKAFQTPRMMLESGVMYEDRKKKIFIYHNQNRFLARNYVELGLRTWHHIMLLEKAGLPIASVEKFYLDVRKRGDRSSWKLRSDADKRTAERMYKATFIEELTPAKPFEVCTYWGQEKVKPFVITTDVYEDTPIQSLCDYARGAGFLVSPVRNHVQIPIDKGLEILENTLFIRTRHTLMSHVKSLFLYREPKLHGNTWNVMGLPHVQQVSDDKLLNVLIPELRSML